MTDNNVAARKSYRYKVKAIASKTAANSVYSLQKKIKCGYLSGEKTTTRYVVKPWVSAYEFPDSNTKAISLPYMMKVKMGEIARTASTGTWRRVFWQDNLYYVWIAKGDSKLTSKKSNFKYSGETEYQQEVLDVTVDIALNWNTVYAHNQSQGIKNTDGTYGFDCSGFVSYVHNKVMQKSVPTYKITASISKLHLLSDVYNAGLEGEFCGYEVKEEEMQPADTLFFYRDGEVYHCGIYLGNGEYAHSSSYQSCNGDGVMISPLKGRDKDTEMKVRRFLPEKVIPANKEMYTKSCKLYREKNSDSEVLFKFAKGDVVTVLFTDSGKWAYVETTQGLKGFVYLAYLEEKEL